MPLAIGCDKRFLRVRFEYFVAVALGVYFFLERANLYCETLWLFTIEKSNFVAFCADRFDLAVVFFVGSFVCLKVSSRFYDFF